ncbi:beta-class carbonic anhydrase [Aerosakkonemataceae cyanobacterium BLCC-F50]|uniref:carbonic anhydrase n=1 Tax=Floridaenema flaviceps BLCC-F50 TaxID=3153642 RepID=A0ABV4XK59_9CYAN
MLHQQIDQKLTEKEAWALRRQLGIPNNKRLWVLACMDERLPVEKALGIAEGDAHIFRNAGGLVTDDAIRSAMLTTQFFGTKEIIVINHTECGMMTASGDLLSEILLKRGINIDEVSIDPALPQLKLPKGVFSKWIKTFTDVDEVCLKQVELLQSSPLIPQDVVVTGYIWEVETGSLRRPYQRLSQKVNTAEDMAAKTSSNSHHHAPQTV